MRSILCACVAATLCGAASLVRADEGFGVPGVADQDPGPGAGPDALGAVKSLYLAAAYEDALAALASLPPAADADQADKLRALCLLALSRTEDAQRALTRLATRRPTLELDEAESPKLRAMFREARAQALPAAIKALYSAAKSSFEQGELTKAFADFSDVIRLTSEEELAGDATIADIKLLAEGFAKLAKQQLVAAPPAAATDPAAGPGINDRTDDKDDKGDHESPGEPEQLPPPGTDAQPPASGDAARAAAIYSAEDGDVVPPVVIDQTIPKWTPPTIGDSRYQMFSGVLEVVVDETGAVMSVSLPQRVNVMYDQILINAARRWRYRPALLNGQPVKYRKHLNVVLHSAERWSNQNGPQEH